MSNPFDDNNAWSSSAGPAYGSAYEDTNKIASPPLPPRNNKTPTYNNVYDNNAYTINSPPAATTAYHHNAWEGGESNKVLDERYATPVQQQNAYQYSGTPYGNLASTPQPGTPVTTTTDNNISSNTKEINNVDREGRRYRPSRLRILLRIILLIASVGYLGFSAGASAYSGEDIPFDSTTCFYFLFAVGAFSFAYSLFHVIFYFVRWFGSSGKMKRPLLIMFDLFMCLMWGIGVVVEISQYRCSPGGYHHWCDFYNTSIFFGFLSFVVYIIAFGWDIFGACKSSRK